MRGEHLNDWTNTWTFVRKIIIVKKIFVHVKLENQYLGVHLHLRIVIFCIYASNSYSFDKYPAIGTFTLHIIYLHKINILSRCYINTYIYITSTIHIFI